MKKNKFLAIILGVAIFCGIVCSALILVTGVKNSSTAFANVPKRGKYPKPHTLEKTKIEEFSEVSINLSYSNVSVLPSDGFYLEYRLDGTCKPDYKVTEGKFYFQEGGTLQKYQSPINLFLNPMNQGPYYLNLYLPTDHYLELLSLTMESGDAELEQINAKKANLRLDYGDLTLGDFTGTTLGISMDSGSIEQTSITCENLEVVASYGNFMGDTVSVSGNCEINMDSGNLELSSLTAGACSIDSEYGDCNIGKMKAGSLSCSLDSGNLTLKNAALESADINAQYGDATLQVAGKISDYNYNLQTEYGGIEFGRKQIASNEDGGSIYQSQDSKKKKNIQIYCESGDEIGRAHV